MTTLAATIAVDKDEFIEVEAQLEHHDSILQDHTRHLDALLPTLLEGIGRDITELYDRPGKDGQMHRGQLCGRLCMRTRGRYKH
ncbi:hypothetical protein Tco_0809152 [Tanacetum coccineum]